MEESYHEEAFNCSSVSYDNYYDLPPIAASSGKDDDFMEVPLSPDSRKYQLKMSMLQEKYEEIQNSNEMLKNRLLQVKKEITQHQRLKRVLVSKLESLGDNYYNKVLELPELVEAPKSAPTAEELQKEKKRRERKERDRIREKARKAAKREADRRAKLIAEGRLPPDQVQPLTQPQSQSQASPQKIVSVPSAPGANGTVPLSSSAPNGV